MPPRSYRRRKRLLAPYGGDAERALAERTAKMLAVTASTRNAKEDDAYRAFADVLAKMLAVTASTGTSRNAKEAGDVDPEEA